jgi:hypothetical protein
MLQVRLRNHPGISLPTAESHFIVPLCRAPERFGDLSRIDSVREVLRAMHRQSAEFLETDLHGLKFDVDSLAEVLHAEGRQTMPDLIRGLLELNARWEGKTRWGDKTPCYVLNIPKILEWFPDAQIVHLIRDGRDVALSMFGRRHDFYVYNTYHAAKYWQQYVERGREYGRALRDDQYFELRYEDMLADPEQEMKRLCAFLNEDYDSTLFDVAPNATPGKTPLVHKPIKAENANKWRERMSRYQVYVFESAAHATLQQAGYALSTTARPLPLPVRAAYRLHNAAMRGLNRSKQGRK